MSALNNALNKLNAVLSKRIEAGAPFRATVTDTDGNLTEIQRLTATAADAEQYAKVTTETFVPGDEVMCLPMNGKPVVIGKVWRTGSGTPDAVYTQAQVDALISAVRPRTNSTNVLSTVAVPSAGDYTLTGSSVTVSGLQPSTLYRFTVNVSAFLANGAAGEVARFLLTFAGGGTNVNVQSETFEPYVNRHDHSWVYSIEKLSSGAGELTVTPHIRWVAGSYHITAMTTVATATLA